MGAESAADGGKAVVATRSSDSENAGQYYIYSSKAGKSPAANVSVLTAGTNSDKFVTALKQQVIVLEATPAPNGNFDASDDWAKWLTKFDTAGQFSLKVDSTANLESFTFHFTQPWNMVFSSSVEALNFSFGAPVALAPSNASPARLPVPGIDEGGVMLYCGLEPQAMGIIRSTVKDMFTYAGLAKMLSFLPSFVPNLATTLDPAKAGGKHNALWFRPIPGYETTIRLQFELDRVSQLNEYVAKVLPGFVIKSANAICKKVLVEGRTANGSIGVDKGLAILNVECSVSPRGRPDVTMRAEVGFFESGVSIICQLLDSRDALVGLLLWFGGLIADDLGFVSDFLSKESVFSAISPRRIKITLDTSEDKEKPTLASFGIDIEVAASFGGGSEQKPVVFLVSYGWNERTGKSGFIQGDLWNWFDFSPDKDLSPYYESSADLQPIEKNAASSLNLLSVIPGQNIDNVPEIIPTDITRAYVFLSATNFAVGGTIQTKAKVGSSPVPQPPLGAVRLDASYAWGKRSEFKLSLGVMASLPPPPESKHRDTAILRGQLDYSSAEKSWQLSASLQGLYASALAHFFDPDSAQHVLPVIDSIKVGSLTLDYRYKDKVGSYFLLTGQLLFAELQLNLLFEHKDDWTFLATLKPQSAETTLGSIFASILGDGQLDMPDFLANVKFNGDKDGLSVKVHRGAAVKGQPQASNGSVFFVAELAVAPMSFTFAQFHAQEWEKTVPSKRMVKVALTELPLDKLDVPLIGMLTKPFDEMYFLWVQDTTGRNPDKLAGFTRKEIGELNTRLSDSLVQKDKFKDPKDADVLLNAGCHFTIVIKKDGGTRTCLLDYRFATKAKERGLLAETADMSRTASEGALALAAEDEDDDGDGSSASAPLKKKVGPLSISNIGLKYANKKLHIMFDATFDLGPLAFSLLGFSVKLGMERLGHISDFSVGIDGLSAAFEKKPLTIAGIIRHGTKEGLDYYAGGIIVGFVPYLFEAAGFYGRASPPGGSPFTSVFIFARLNGPLVTLEFAEISGVTGGFGYQSSVRAPRADQCVDFPFIATRKLDGAGASALASLERLTSPDAGGWFAPLADTYWAAAGLKVEAFKMLALNAVVVVQFGASVRLGIFAVALADIPTAASPLKFAHVEIGIAVVVDFDTGIFQAEAQLAPNSFILHPSCHLTGGCALYYWFDAPRAADRSLIGSFVFTLGGYHQAFTVPANYPNPPRLGISWRLGSTLSVTGEAYFAITPKACMGGGRLRAQFAAGPVRAWFDAAADFLINYKPFHFQASARISVGAAVQIDFLFIHKRISVEIGADLYLWGPPLAGRVHCKVWIISFEISFGDSPSGVEPISLVAFYELVLQASSQEKQAAAAIAAGHTSAVDAPAAPEPPRTQRPPNEGHVFLAQSGLMNASESPERKPNAPWVVRGGTFSFVVSGKMAIDKAEVGEGEKKTTLTDAEVFSRPMQLTSGMSSVLAVKIKQDGVAEDDSVWPAEKFTKAVPTGLWAKYSSDTDPMGGNNKIPSLLDGDDRGMTLMMGVLLTAPPPVMAPDKLHVFNIADADLQNLPAKKPFPTPEPAHGEWEPGAPLEHAAQWDAVHAKWLKPDWAAGDADVQTQFVKTWVEALKWAPTPLAQVAKMPARLDAQFNQLYVESPLLTK